MVLDEEFRGPSFVQCLQGSINTSCCLIQILQIKFVILWLLFMICNSAVCMPLTCKADILSLVSYS